MTRRLKLGKMLRWLIRSLWPESLLVASPWHDEWLADRRRRTAKTMRYFFWLAAFGYLGHYFFVDVPNNKQPQEAWFWFRMAATGLCVMTALFYTFPVFNKSRFFIWPAIFVMALGCYAQANVSLYHPETPWFFAFFFVFGGVLLLNTSPLRSVLFALPVMLTYLPPLLEANVPLYQILSAVVVCCLVTIVVRMAFVFEIRSFLLTQERDETRKEVISLGKDYEGRLKSFIPRVIADRIQGLIDHDRLSVLEATLLVLKAEKKEVCCFWSDIRGFTQGSRNLDSFLFESVLPEVKACSDAVENNSGIPRKIGDLIFAYFDDDSNKTNLVRAIQSGIDLAVLNEDMNESVSSEFIKRYILISTGEAIVGNVGGLNSGVEITALGPPVNFLSRLDDATKQKGLADKLKPGDIILCEKSHALLKQITNEVECVAVDLVRSNVSIKDFPEVDSLFVLTPDRKVAEVFSRLGFNLSSSLLPIESGRASVG